MRKAVRKADVAQSVEHSLGKGEVIGSIPIISSRFRVAAKGVCPPDARKLRE
jgi:hypothetical protein